MNGPETDDAEPEGEEPGEETPAGGGAGERDGRPVYRPL